MPQAFSSIASAHRTATSTAFSNAPERPSRSALRRAASKTFSKMYGTARKKVGRKAARSGSRAAAFSCGWWPKRTRPRIAATCTIRPNTCASGRKSRVAASSPLREWNTGSQRSMTVSAFET
ncbi:hypothetical protein SGLAM104S_04377 [Streptomyces glaucescens]